LISEIFIILLLLGLLLSLVLTTILKKPDSRSRQEVTAERETKTTECPLCGKELNRGERVHSVVYSQGEDRLMSIYGCPWCYSAHPSGYRKPFRDRRCPSCGRPLKEGSFAIARVFERPGRKVHVHVLGCPVCRREK
jgi:uncharacterized protein with PIN domain